MSAGWPTAKMGEIAPLVRRPVLPEADKLYREIGIRSFGKGVFHKTPTTGLEIGSKRVFAVEPGDLLFNIVFAWEGATAVATESERGMIGSHRFLTCVTDHRKADARFLNYWFTHTEGRERLLQASPGGAGRNRTLGVEKLAAIRVPLPSLDEQCHIVARIEKLAVKVDEVVALKSQTKLETEKLLASYEMAIWPEGMLRDAPPLHEVTAYLSRGRQSEQGESEHYLVKTQHVQMGRYIPTAIRLAEHIARKVQPDGILHQGDILIACSAAGCLGRVARYADVGKVGSTDTHVAIARANPDVIDPDYLYAYLRGAQGQYQLRSRERGDWQREKISFRLTELNLADLKNVPVPLLSKTEQRHIVKLLDNMYAKFADMVALQTETAVELDSMLPAILDKAFKGEL